MQNYGYQQSMQGYGYQQPMMHPQPVMPQQPQMMYSQQPAQAYQQQQGYSQPPSKQNEWESACLKTKLWLEIVPGKINFLTGEIATNFTKFVKIEKKKKLREIWPVPILQNVLGGCVYTTLSVVLCNP